MMSSPLATSTWVRVQLPQQVASTLTSVSPLQSGAWQLQQNCTLEERAAPMCCCSPSPSLSLFFSFFGRQKALHGGCGITRNTLAKGAAGRGCHWVWVRRNCAVCSHNYFYGTLRWRCKQQQQQQQQRVQVGGQGGVGAGAGTGGEGPRKVRIRHLPPLLCLANLWRRS